MPLLLKEERKVESRSEHEYISIGLTWRNSSVDRARRYVKLPVALGSDITSPMLNTAFADELTGKVTAGTYIRPVVRAYRRSVASSVCPFHRIGRRSINPCGMCALAFVCPAVVIMST